MTLLNNVITAQKPSAPKGIIYGPPGIGKTTMAALAPGSLIIDCENGAGAIACKRTPYLDKWNDILCWLQSIEQEKHSYKILAIDSVDWLIRRIEEHVSGCANNRPESTLNRSHGGYGNGKQVLKNYVYQILLPLLDRIVAKGISVVLIAHAKRTTITDIDGISEQKTAPELPDKYLNMIVEWSDFVCLARKDGDGIRQLVTQETSRALAKNRYNLPEVLPFDWNSFQAAIGAGLAQAFPSTTEKRN